MKIILTGATGMVGSEVFRQALADPEISHVTTLTRRSSGIQHTKLTEIIHKNFSDYSELENIFKDCDACIWCLGISQSLVTKEEYHRITYDYAVAAASAMLKANPSITFLFLSGAGADQTEKSKTLFARVKGKTENALLRLPFKKIYIARPAGIKPKHIKKTSPWYEKFFFLLYPFLKIVLPSMVITSEELAKGMLHVAKDGADTTIIENNELKKICSL